MPGRMEFEFQFRGSKRPPSFGSEARMRILLMGDFSARGSRGFGEPELGRRPLLRIDAETFDAVLAQLAPRLRIPGATAEATPLVLDFAALDDFHPDQLAPKLEAQPGFQFPPALVSADREPAPSAVGGGGVGKETRPTAAATGEEDTMARLLGGGLPPAAPGGADISALLKHVVAPHITPAVDPRLPRQAAAAQQTAGQRLRDLLHEPGFQRLEAAWRAVHRLVHSVESEDVTVSLLDVSRQELAVDLAAGPDGCALHRRLGDAHPAWSLLIADEFFGPAADDVAQLAALGAIASQTGAPLIAGADPQIDWAALSETDAARWQSLRHSPAAGWIGLALPRWLLRLPYGPKTNPVESFPFDEFAATRPHEAYLWGNPAYACALLAAAAFRDRGADMALGDVVEIDRLPCHTYREEGEARMQPCAEVFLSERLGTTLLGRGLIPLASSRDRNAIRVLRFQSIADPPAALAGPWK